jgi:hypothetical protein
MKSSLLLIGLCAVLILATGCASPARPAAMVPATFNIQNKHPHSVGVTADGGRETKPMEKSEISTAAFVEAVSSAVQQSGVFTSVVQAADAKYKLEVLIVGVDQPLLGFDMTVNMSTHWKLSDAAGKSVFQDFIRSTYKATVGDAFVGIERLRLATEGAARENIKQGVERLSALKL